MIIKRRTQTVKGRFDIAPLIDIVFLLLIFFMLSSSFVLQPGIRVNLPEAFHSEVESGNKDIVITLTSYGNLYFNDKIVSVGNLLPLLLKKKKKSVILRSDQDVHLKSLIQIWDICCQSGVSSIQISTVPKKMNEN